jgi:hypothetical protein
MAGSTIRMMLQRGRSMGEGRGVLTASRRSSLRPWNSKWWSSIVVGCPRPSSLRRMVVDRGDGYRVLWAKRPCPGGSWDRGGWG